MVRNGQHEKKSKIYLLLQIPFMNNPLHIVCADFTVDHTGIYIIMKSNKVHSNELMHIMNNLPIQCKVT